MSECGSLFLPTDEEVAILRQSLEKLQAEASLFSGKAEEKLIQAIYLCEQLQRKFSVIIANPPYMGSSNMDKWLAKWTTKHYADTKRDLCTCFIERGFSLAVSEGYSSMVTMESWMFLGSFEKFRKRVLGEKTIATMTYMNHMVMRIAFNTCATVFLNHFEDMPAVSTKVEYKKLNENGTPERFPVADEDIYRRRAEDFKAIPGSPIAYWASDASLSAFGLGESIASKVAMPYGFKTGDNDRFLRLWWEVGIGKELFTSRNNDDAARFCKKWFSYNKGGQYRRWYGNNEYVVNYENSGREIIIEASIDKRSAAGYSSDLYFKPTLTWSRISSGKLAMRYSPCGAINDMTGPGLYASNQTLAILQGFLNSSVAAYFAEMISPTLDFQPGQIGSYPVIDIDTDTCKRVENFS